MGNEARKPPKCVLNSLFSIHHSKFLKQIAPLPKGEATGRSVRRIGGGDRTRTCKPEGGGFQDRCITNYATPPLKQDSLGSIVREAGRLGKIEAYMTDKTDKTDRTDINRSYRSNRSYSSTHPAAAIAGASAGAGAGGAGTSSGAAGSSSPRQNNQRALLCAVRTRMWFAPDFNVT